MNASSLVAGLGVGCLVMGVVVTVATKKPQGAMFILGCVLIAVAWSGVLG